MDKLIYTGDNDNLVRACGGVLAAFFDADHVKSAASSAFSQAMIRQHIPDDQHFGVHLIAMGCGEDYGFNKNGDWWTRDGLKHSTGNYGVHTFVKNGAYYLEHNNRGPEVARGVIKAAAYNDDMQRAELIVWGDKNKAEEDYQYAKAGKTLTFSMSARVPDDECLPAGTRILTKNGWNTVETIEVGDLVWTDKFRWRAVTRLFQNQTEKRKGRIVSFSFSDFPLALTDNHPVLSLCKGEATKNQAAFVRPIKDQDRIIGLNGWNFPGMVAASELTPGDYVLCAAGAGVDAPDLDAWLIGLYLADGCLMGSGRRRDHSGEWCSYGVAWTLGYAKNAVRERLKTWLEKQGLKYTEQHDEDRHSYVVKCFNTELGQSLHAAAGRTHSKHLPFDWPSWKREHLVSLLAGWLDGDGSQDDIKQTLRGSSNNRDLVTALVAASYAAGLNASVQERKNTGNWSTGQLYWSLHFATDATSILVKYTTRFSPPDDTHPGKIFTIWHQGREYVALRISRLDTVEFAETFNFSVAEDETYIAENVVVHNCSVCGHRAKRSRDYCGHLKQSMTRWVPAFSKFAYAINHQPNFFDISRVRNPADRIAHWLEYILPDEELAKAASANGSSFLFSDLQAKIAGVNLPEDIRLGCSTARRTAILEKLAAAEHYFYQLDERPDLVAHDARRHFAKHAAPYCFDPFSITDTEIAAMRRLEPDVLFGHLAKRAAVLPFLPFFAYVTGKTVKQASEDPVFMLAQERFIPGMFARALKTSSDSATEDLFQVAPSEKIAACCTEDPVDKIMESVADKTTVEKPRVSVRILRICSSTPELSGCGVKSASEVSPEQATQAQALAHAYAMYKVAFVEAVSDAQGQLSVDEPVLMLLTYPQKV